MQLEYSFLPPGSFSDEQSAECVGEIKETKRENNRIGDGEIRERDPILFFEFGFGFLRGGGGNSGDG